MALHCANELLEPDWLIVEFVSLSLESTENAARHRKALLDNRTLHLFRSQMFRGKRSKIPKTSGGGSTPFVSKSTETRSSNSPLICETHLSPVPNSDSRLGCHPGDSAATARSVLRTYSRATSLEPRVPDVPLPFPSACDPPGERHLGLTLPRPPPLPAHLREGRV